MCGLKEIFEGAGNFFDKKVPYKSHFYIREKLNLIRFISILYKIKFPSSVTAWHLLYQGESLKNLLEAAFELAFSSVNLYYPSLTKIKNSAILNTTELFTLFRVH